MKNHDPFREIRWFLTALLLLFIALKLTGHIDWSWWWVMAPLWGPWPLLILCAVVVWIARMFETPREKNVRELKDSFRAYADALDRKNRS